MSLDSCLAPACVFPGYVVVTKRVSLVLQVAGRTLNAGLKNLSSCIETYLTQELHIPGSHCSTKTSRQSSNVDCGLDCASCSQCHPGVIFLGFITSLIVTVRVQSE